MLVHPLDTWLVDIVVAKVVNTGLDQDPQAFLHFSVDISHPLFDLLTRLDVYRCLEHELFAFWAIHTNDNVVDLRELKAGDVIEHLTDLWLNLERVACAT